MSEVTLWEYFEARLEALDRHYAHHLALNNTALEKAEHTMNARLQGMNEFRDALKDQASRMATRTELQTLELMVQELRREKANMDGRLAALSATVSLVVTVAFWILSRVIK